ncbi:hypothetical protein K438DRAFT_1967991 [Mycena galopus ATCC 62051]|nr:hypothetical protein K438DRAFT_1967991 [Mycena galopus ATCC 62051]
MSLRSRSGGSIVWNPKLLPGSRAGFGRSHLLKARKWSPSLRLVSLMCAAGSGSPVSCSFSTFPPARPASVSIASIAISLCLGGAQRLGLIVLLTGGATPADILPVRPTSKLYSSQRRRDGSSARGYGPRVLSTLAWFSLPTLHVPPASPCDLVRRISVFRRGSERARAYAGPLLPSLDLVMERKADGGQQVTPTNEQGRGWGCCRGSQGEFKDQERRSRMDLTATRALHWQRRRYHHWDSAGLRGCDNLDTWAARVPSSTSYSGDVGQSLVRPSGFFAFEYSGLSVHSSHRPTPTRAAGSEVVLRTVPCNEDVRRPPQRLFRDRVRKAPLPCL